MKANRREEEAMAKMEERIDEAIRSVGGIQKMVESQA